MSAMSDFSLTPASSSSPAPSPPPVSPPKKGPSAAKAPSPDSGSELSELTEDEQDAGRASPHSDTPGDNKRITKKRNPIVPEPMWNWAYKTPGRRATESEEPLSAVTKMASSNLNAILAAADAAADDDVKELDTTKAVSGPAAEDADNGGEEADHHESDDDDADSQDGVDGCNEPPPRDDARESSTALTEDDDADRDSGWVGSEAESEEDEPAAEDEDEDNDSVAPSDNGDDDDDDEETAPKNNDTAPVVPSAPAASSIMAGQQLIKTPSVSPSTSPEPEDEPGPKDPPLKDAAPGLAVEKIVKTEPTELEANVDNDGDVDADDDNDNDNENEGREVVDRVDAEADLDQDAEADVDAEEAEMDLQPAHRAEALDVLAGIELKFALVREALYVEKMEELAMEEALILQGVHPEMTYLQAELQVRHDRRLDLAEKKRKCEDGHVTLMRKTEENGVWSWWKFERDILQMDMFAEANRKRRKLEREKNKLERVQPVVFRIPPAPSGPLAPKQVTVRDLVDFVSANSGSKRESLKRKRKEPPELKYNQPALAVLSAQEIQSDLQILTARARNYLPHAGDIGSGIGMAPPFEPHYIDYSAQGINGHPSGHGVYAHPIPPPPIGMHHPYQPPPSGRAYPQPGPPMGSIYHPQTRMQGPGAPPGSYHPSSGRGFARTPSPPMMQGYDHGAVPPPIPGTSGPGLHWTPIPPASASSSNNGAGPSKPAINGSGNRRVSAGKDAYDRDREARAERERASIYHENGIREGQDEHGRMHGPHGSTLQQSQHPHRHTSMHQSLQGVPHHHHVVHHRHANHHHHPPSSRSGGSQHAIPRAHELDRHISVPEHDARYAVSMDQPNNVPKSAGPNPFWKQEEVDAREGRHRDHGRGPPIAPALGPLPTSQAGPADRQSFMMTPSQIVQGGFTPRPGEGGPSRREHWADDGPHGRGHYDPPEGQYGSMPPLDGPARHSGHMHMRQTSNGIGSPHPRNGIPQSPPPPPLPSGPGVAPSAAYASHLTSPTRLSLGSAHASPRVRASTPKTRPISPLPATVGAKHLPPSASGFTGPGTPGSGGAGASRLGTPGLAGLGTRPDGPPNGHAIGISHGAGLYPSGGALSGPAQPMLPPESAHMAPPKLTAVQLGNGA